MSIKLGQMVKDVITGFRGVAISRVEVLNGSVQFEVQPPVGKDGKWLDGKWIQEKSLAGVKDATTEAETPDTGEIDEPEMDDDFAPPVKKAKAGKQKAAFDEDEEEAEQSEEESDTEEEEEAPPKKKGKAAKVKKLTTDDLNGACKARVARLIEDGNGKITGKMARDNVLKLLKKNFETDTVSDIEDQDEMARAIKLLGGK